MGARGLVFDAAEVERLAHRDDGGEVAPGLGDRGVDERVDLVGGFAEEHEADVVSAQQFVDGERIEALGERFFFPEPALQRSICRRAC